MVRWSPRLIRGVEWALLFAGTACLVWFIVIWSNATSYELSAKREMAELVAIRARERLTLPSTLSRISTLPDSLVGILDVPRVGLSVAVVEGDDDRALAIGVGHLPDTPLPWEHGNVALAGHRDTFFRPLQNIRAGDDVRVSTRHGTYDYRVREVMVVDPGDVWVLDSVEGVSLTLVTCYPFRYVGSAPQRFVVWAERVGRPPAGSEGP